MCHVNGLRRKYALVAKRERPFGEEVVMTAQHAPHSPPLWRKFLSLPHTRLGWVAVGLASPVWAFWLYVLYSIYGIIPSLLSGNEIPMEAVEGLYFVLLFSGLLVIPGAAAGVFALLRSHDRSLLVWLAIVPALIFVALVFLFSLVSPI
jgi:hypothetical protein